MFECACVLIVQRYDRRRGKFQRALFPKGQKRRGKEKIVNNSIEIVQRPFDVKKDCNANAILL